MEEFDRGGIAETQAKKKQRRISQRPVSVVTPGGAVVSLDVLAKCSVLNLKKMLAEKVGTSPLGQHLLMGSKMLVGGDLQQLELPPGALLTLIQTHKTLV